MTILSIFTTTEFYVTMFVLAGAIVAFSAMPRKRGPVRELLLPGKLSACSPSATPSISIEVRPDNSIALLRSGIEDVEPLSDAVSIAVAISGFSIDITERIHSVSSSTITEPKASSAMFIIDGTAPERYHIRYTSPSTQLSATMALTLKPGTKYCKNLAK